MQALQKGPGGFATLVQKFANRRNDPESLLAVAHLRILKLRRKLCFLDKLETSRRACAIRMHISLLSVTRIVARDRDNNSTIQQLAEFHRAFTVTLVTVGGELFFAWRFVLHPIFWPKLCEATLGGEGEKKTLAPAVV